MNLPEPDSLLIKLGLVESDVETLA
jgi:hypothetical protein